MPKIYKLFGIIFLFYSHDHEPVHIHARKAGRESKAEIMIENGVIISIKIKNVQGKLPLIGSDMKNFKAFVEWKKEDIRQKWIDFYINKITPEMEEYLEIGKKEGV